VRATLARLTMITWLTAAVAILICAAPLAAEAQAGKILRIGYLTLDPGNPYRAAFRQGLAELGYVEGQNIVLEIRTGDRRPERLPELAAELVRLKVDVILATGNPAIAAAQKTTTSIPIVMAVANDPVALGFVASLARPGGNITGLTLQAEEIAAKRLQILKEALPSLSRVAVLWDPGFLGSRRGVKEAEAVAPTLGVQLHLVEVQRAGELDGAFAAAVKERAGATFIGGGAMLFAHRIQVAELAVKRRLPTTCPLPEFVEAGCLISYGPSISDQNRRAAYFVDRILKGAKPADLPVEQPTKFYLTINMKTARALGLRIPQPLLLRADRLID